MIVTFEEFLNESTSKSEKYFGVSLDYLKDILDYWVLDIDVDQYSRDDQPIIDKYIDDLYNKIIDKTSGGVVDLYRLVWVKKVSDINKDKLGKHWAEDLNVFYENKVWDLWDMTHEEKSEKTGLDMERDMWIIHIQTPPSNIHLKKTLIAQCEFPIEREFYLKSQDNIKIVDIFNVDWDNWEYR